LGLTRLTKSQGFKNSLWTFLSSIAYPILLLISTPFFIHKLGAEQFGIWVLINTMLQIISSLNLGLGDSIIKFISQYDHLTQKDEIDKMVSTVITLTLFITITVSSLGLGVSYAVDITKLINVSSSSSTIAIWSLRLALLIISIRFIDLILLAVLQGFNRYDLSAKFSFTSKGLILLANVVCVQLGGNLVIIFLSTLIVQLCYLFIEVKIIKNRYSFISFFPSHSSSRAKRILSFGIWSWLQSVVAMVTIQVDKLIVAHFSGLEVLSYYSLGSMLAIQIHTIFLSISAWVFPAVSKRIETREPLKPFYNNAQALLLMFGYSSLIILFLLEKQLFTIWLGQDSYRQSIIFIKLFLCYNLFLLPNIIPYYFLNGAGFVKYNTLSEFILKILNITSMVIFYNYLGATGLVWGLIVSTAFVLPLKTALSNRFALGIANRWYGFESLCTGTCLVICFLNNDLAIKGIAAFIALLFFYYIYLRNSSVLDIVRNRVHPNI
jgi:O-antigen/teichoic acid export membrane protein